MEFEDVKQLVQVRLGVNLIPPSGNLMKNQFKIYTGEHVKRHVCSSQRSRRVPDLFLFCKYIRIKYTTLI